MTEAKETEDRRVLIAEDINEFLASVRVPALLRVKPENITLLESGARVMATFGDVNAQVDIGTQSLTYLAIARGIVVAGQRLFRGSR